MATSSEVFQTRHLDAHNRYRAKHGCPPLRLSDGLCNYAQDWAEELAERRRMDHREGCDFGENVYMVYSDPPKELKGHEPVESWYAEISKFRDGFSPDTGHFTQLVWKASIELGVGKTTNQFGETYVVTNYHPPGNVYGQFDDNVPGLEGSDAKEDESGFSAFELAHLQAHNTHRTEHLCPPLELSHSLCHYAQDWADRLASRRVMEHRVDSTYGENLYMMSAADPPVEIPGEKPVNLWYHEERHFRYGRDGFSEQTGHFTQVVWKASKRLGVAKATNRLGETYVVTNYDPPGNYQGHFDANVPPKYSS